MKSMYPCDYEKQEVTVPMNDFKELSAAFREKRDCINNNSIMVSKELYEKMEQAMRTLDGYERANCIVLSKAAYDDYHDTINFLHEALDEAHKLQDKQMVEIADLTKQNRELQERNDNQAASLALDLKQSDKLREKLEGMDNEAQDYRHLLEFWKAKAALFSDETVRLSNKLAELSNVPVAIAALPTTAYYEAETARFIAENTTLASRLVVSGDYIKNLERARDEGTKDRLQVVNRLIKENGRLLKYKRNFDKLMALFNNIQICHSCLLRGNRAIVDLGLDNELEPVDGNSYSFGEAGKPLC